jgi:general secretion pathway protein G
MVCLEDKRLMSFEWFKTDTENKKQLFRRKIMETKRNRGFTLVEILIVVVILGILAAIVIPQFTDAATEASQANLVTNLQTLRSQIALYRIQHVDADPDTSTLALFTTDMVPDYMQSIPLNPLSAPAALSLSAGAGAAAANDTHWYFDTTTHIMHANDSVISYGL